MARPADDSGTIPGENEKLEKIQTLDEEVGDVKQELNPHGPPNGGWEAWSTVFGTSLVAFGTFGMVNAYGAFADFYNEVYLTNYSATIISMIGALQVFLMYLLAGTSGAVFDSIGPRYLIPGSGIVVTFALFMLSITKPQQIYQQFLSQSVLFSLGATCSFFPSMGLLAHWFTTKLPYAMGFLSIGGSIGGIVFPIMMSRLIPKIGFGWTVRIFAFITLFCFAIGSFTIKQRRPSKPFPPFSRLFDFAAFKDPCYLLLALGCWFSIFALFNPFFYVGLSAQVASPGSNVNGYYLAILCAFSIPGRVLPGLIAIKVGRFNTVWISLLIASVLIFALWYTSFAKPNLIAFSALYGAFSGPFFSVAPACVAEISPIEKVGARLGGTFAFMASAMIAGTPIAGVFIKKQTEANFKNLILFSGVMSFIGTAFIFAARMLRQPKLFAKA
ncbi:hypothetical protein GYMLUDRAFT_230316 [Collybiopsis luxurians FD-317 M1]|uniref:Major facilitator superfamily (MFS) profile domain-containing protein n=1 Tax=Collybiopsis luxurians FD-317 M1 TaxID=944289 RepID=A0A0D0C1K5_9AGAR|nr:hypothetical protein GYMLUDRAFT_230316 [Collybiopsis luxurians FD-317 M1]